MAKLTLNIVANNTAALKSIADLEARLGKVGSSGVKVLNKELATTAKVGNTATYSLDRFVYSLQYRAVHAFTNSLKDALNTMKAVDTELVSVRKVTNATTRELEKMKDAAYEVAAAYGTSPDSMLSNVTAFAKAGYGLAAGELGELAAKTMIVGDTTAQVAQQFLLSVDAAYHYKGEVSDLSRVLDGLNEIENKNATTIEKIADGMGIVAPIASQARVGIDELAAAIGTITAVTQRSGSEAARALRALFLNIIGDTKTEIDEGVTWTTGEIAGLREVLNLYASDVVKAAEATGQVINPMEAIAALAQSFEEGILTEAKLMEMVSDIGGKLRSSQLLAIVQKWDMYEKMLNEYSSSFGSAEREVENAMDSWERKAQTLETKWAEFWDGTLSTDTIKGSLDLLGGLVDVMDTTAGRAVALSAGLGAVGAAMAVIGNSNAFKKITAQIMDAETRAATLKATIAGIGVGVAISVISWIADAVQDSKEAYDNQVQAVDSLRAEYESLYGVASEYYELSQKNVLDLTEAERNRLAVLQAQETSLRAQLQLEQQKEYEAFRYKKDTPAAWWEDFFGTTDDSWRLYAAKYNTTPYELQLQDFREAIDIAFSKRGSEYSEDEFILRLNEIIAAYKDEYEEIARYRDLGFELRQEELMLAAMFEATTAVINGTADSYWELSNAAETVSDTTQFSMDRMEERLKSLNSLLDQAQSSIQTVNDAWAEYQETGSLAAETLQSLASLGPEFLAVLVDENRQIQLNQEAMDGLIAQKENLIAQLYAEQIASYTLTLVQQELAAASGDLGNAENDAASEVDKATDALTRQAYAVLTDAAAVESLRGAIEGVSGGLSSNAVDRIFSQVGDFAGRSRALLNSYSYKGGSSSGSAGSSSVGGASMASGLSELTGAYQTLANAVSEYNQAGYLTVDTFNQILALEPQHLALLIDENGQLAINEASYRAMTQAKIDDAAASQALAMAEEALRLATAGDAEALAVLLGQTVVTTSATWAHVEAIYAQISAMESAGQVATGTAAALRQLIDTYQKLSTAAVQGLGQVSAAAASTSASVSSSAMSAANSAEDIRKKLEEVEKAKKNLAEAKSERTVRVYNAETGQWEWVADARAVQDAQDAYDRANSAYMDSIVSSAQSAPAAKKPTAYNEPSAPPTLKAAAPGTVKKLLGIMPGANTPTLTRVYDSGGVLHGLGGIKATAQDEMVLPPDLTRMMLSPTASGSFARRANELRWLYGGRGTAGGIGSQHNGDVYQFGDISIGAEKAKQTSVYQLAQMAKTMRIHSNTQN